MLLHKASQGFSKNKSILSSMWEAGDRMRGTKNRNLDSAIICPPSRTNDLHVYYCFGHTIAHYTKGEHRGLYFGNL